MALGGLIDSLRLTGAETDLERVVPIRRRLFFLHHHAGTRFDECYGSHVASGTVELSHADFSAYESCHISVPIKMSALSPVSLQFDLDVYPGRDVELAQSVDGLLRRLENIEQAFVRANFVLIARFLVDVRRTVDRESFNSCGQRHWPRH